MNAALSMFPESSRRQYVTVNGWKAISLELDRGVRTVQRWERELCLPIRRLGKGPRSPVFAFKEELQLWLGEIAVEDRSRQVERKPKAEVIVTIENFFNAQSARPKQGRCSHCRSDIKHLDVHFWLYGSEDGWRVSVPFCPTCEPELCKHSPAIVH
jgi:hypothetical protein